MKNLHVLLKQVIFLAIPITLVFSIYINSIACILFLIVFTPDLIKNFNENNTKRNRRIFCVLIAFIGTYLLGFVIDVFYGIVNFRKAERLLPFIIFPLIFLFSKPLKIFNNSKIPLLVYGIFIFCCNLFLMAYLFLSTWNDYKDISFHNDRWEKKNIQIDYRNNDFPNKSVLQTAQITGNSAKDKNELIYNRFFHINKDTFITRSVYVKSNDDIWILVRQFDGDSHSGAWFHPSNGKIGFVQKKLKADIKDIGNGWYRISLTNEISKTAKRERFQLTIVDGDKKYEYNGKRPFHLLLAGDQLEFSKFATDYSPLEHREFWDRFDRSKALKPVMGHPTYYSLYIILSTLIILFFLPSTILKYGFSLVNMVFLIILGSKACILTMFMILIILGIYNIKKENLKKNRLILTLILGSVITMFLFPSSLKRFAQTITSIVGNNKESLLSTDQRINMWESVIKIPFDRLILGNGNIHAYDILNTGMNFQLNMHNQYLEAIVTSGITGLFFLIVFLFGIFFVEQSSKRNILLILFVAMISINLFFENLLNRQWGIVFIAFFLPYFYILQNRNHE